MYSAPQCYYHDHGRVFDYFYFFFFNDTATTEIYTLSLHDALPIYRPLMISGTIEPTGTMLAGQGVEALYVALEHLGIFSIGLNCATGPEFMTDHVRSLSAISTRFVTVYPNAGLPDERGQYGETPQSLAFKMKRFVDEGWVNLIGGCCGTTPAHIRAPADLARGWPAPVPPTPAPPAVARAAVF